MTNKQIKMTIYGAKQICASCVGAPDSKDTYEWLQALISRKYVDDNIVFEYIDFTNPPEEGKHQQFSQRIVDEDLFYPIIFVNDEMAAEGIPRVQTIYRSLENHGAVLQEGRGNK